MNASTVNEFRGLSTSELQTRLQNGHAIDPTTLDNLAYRGISLGLPAWVESLTWKKFRKTFYRDPATGELRGWNVRLKQNGLDAADEPLLRKGTQFTFGHYAVTDGSDRRMPAGTDGGLLIDYGRSTRNPRLDFTRLLRDPVVALQPGDSSVLLGWSYVEFGPFNVSTPSYFLLVDPLPIDHVPA
jgi:hypothetical protein